MFTPLVVGIDIGTYSLQAVVAKAKGKTFDLVAYEEITLDESVIDSKHVADIPLLASVLSQLKKRLPRGIARAVFALPDGVVISKLCALENKLDDQERAFAMRQQIIHSSSTEQLAIDYFVEVSEKLTTTYRVLATRQHVVDHLMAASRQAGFKPAIIDVQSNVVERLMRFTKYHEHRPDWVALDLGHTRMNMGILSSAGSFYSRELVCSFDSALDDILALNDGQQDPEDQGATLPITEEQKYEGYLQSIVAQLRQEFALYRTDAPSGIKGIAIYGGSIVLPDIAQRLSKLLDMPVEIFDPLDALFNDFRAPVAFQSAERNRFVLATGLALRGSQSA